MWAQFLRLWCGPTGSGTQKLRARVGLSGCNLHLLPSANGSARSFLIASEGLLELSLPQNASALSLGLQKLGDSASPIATRSCVGLRDATWPLRPTCVGLRGPDIAFRTGGWCGPTDRTLALKNALACGPADRTSDGLCRGPSSSRPMN